jgi:dipeptidyl aminopeptidase/acylaminoacyl peptidase
MSPFTHAKKLAQNKRRAPLLLIHGASDDNTGTFPLQSERYYAALKGNGAPCRLVMLPHEVGARAYDHWVAVGAGPEARRPNRSPTLQSAAPREQGCVYCAHATSPVGERIVVWLR